jgi:hypothetical protein
MTIRMGFSRMNAACWSENMDDVSTSSFANYNMMLNSLPNTVLLRIYFTSPLPLRLPTKFLAYGIFYMMCWYVNLRYNQ